VRHEILPASGTEGVFLGFGRLLSRRRQASGCAKQTQGHCDLQRNVAAWAGFICLHCTYSSAEPEWL
jgi:hypothetical protein